MSDENSTVSYRAVAGFPGYRIGNDGSVWSRLGRGKAAGTFGEWRPLKPDKQKSGHLLVTLYDNGHATVFSVHRLVLQAFIGPCPEGMEACHFPDRDPSNNRLENLRWDTVKSNHDDKRIHGTLPQGELHSRAKLNENQVREIRRLCNEGVNRKVIADKFGVSLRLVHAIRERKLWKFLED